MKTGFTSFSLALKPNFDRIISTNYAIVWLVREAIMGYKTDKPCLLRAVWGNPLVPNAIRSPRALRALRALIALHNYLQQTEIASYCPTGFVDCESSSRIIKPG